jgi:SAM-dependent methyltransferase
MTGNAAHWSGGYTTDTTYIPGYYPNQSPLQLHLACLLGSVTGVDPAAGPLCYLELGCGHGFGALVLAASNPKWTVTGIDFNPAHIAAARALANETGIANAHFIEADLATLSREPLARDVPDADVVTMHGLWSWVADTVRAGIVDLLASKVKPGGVVQLSYNALPAWQGAIGMQRLVREAGLRLATRSDRQAEAGIEVARALIDANAGHLSENTFARSLLDHVERANSAYLAHEYMTASWRPCFHADVVSALARAKLDWVASAQLLENFAQLMLNDEARQVAARFDDPIMRELVKDMCLSRSLRQDVFVRGPRRLSQKERDAALDDIMLALLCRPDAFVWEIDAPVGKANFERRFFGPIVETLGTGPRCVADLLALPGLPRRDNPTEVVGMLVGSQQAMRVLATPAPPDATVRQLNAAAARHFARSDTLNNSMALATSGSGAPLPCPMLDLFVAARLQNGADADPIGWANELGAEYPEEARGRLTKFIDQLLAERVPIWRQLGALPSVSEPPYDRPPMSML